MKILVISSTSWSNDNSFGNSFTNIFEGIGDNIQFANIYCDYGRPDNCFNMRCYQITPQSLIKNLKDPLYPTGTEITQFDMSIERSTGETNTFNLARKLRWQVLFWARDFLWKIGRWNSPQLRAFLDDFQPDLIFQPVYYSSYMNDIALFVKEYTGAPMVGYISDDNYTLKQFRLSPLYWIDRLWKRRKVKAVIDKCEILYVISEIQKREYEKIFNLPCKILTKCSEFSEKPTEDPEKEIANEIKIVYAGNLGSGRWKSLALLSHAVEMLNKEGFSAFLDIYSATPLTGTMRRKLINSRSRFHGQVSFSDIQKIQKTADIVVHVEGLSLKSRLEVHQSFSTKLVDFFGMAKCIFAIGSLDVASIVHLWKNDAAVIATHKDEVYDRLKYLLENPANIIEYGKKAYFCGKKHHNKQVMQKELLRDLQRVTNKVIKE